jgi:hypothetical protein
MTPYVTSEKSPIKWSSLPTMEEPQWANRARWSPIRHRRHRWRPFVGMNGSIFESLKPRKICKDKLEVSNLFLQGM